MPSVSGNIRFVGSYQLASFGHVQNFKRTTLDKDVRWMNVSCGLICGYMCKVAFKMEPRFYAFKIRVRESAVAYFS